MKECRVYKLPEVMFVWLVIWLASRFGWLMVRLFGWLVIWLVI